MSFSFRCCLTPPPPSNLPEKTSEHFVVQVYNENIRDLLNDTGEFLDLREDPIKVRDGPSTWYTAGTTAAKSNNIGQRYWCAAHKAKRVVRCDWEISIFWNPPPVLTCTSSSDFLRNVLLSNTFPFFSGQALRFGCVFGGFLFHPSGPDGLGTSRSGSPNTGRDHGPPSPRKPEPNPASYTR